MPRVLFHHDCVFAFSDCGFVRLMLGGFVPADWRQSALDGRVLFQKEN